MGPNREMGKLEAEGRDGRRGEHVSRTALASIDLQSIPPIKVRERERGVRRGFTWVQKKGRDNFHERDSNFRCQKE